jgi:UDP-glucose 4-epimerase
MFDVEFVSLRYFNVFGSRQNPDIPYSGAISIFCDKMRQGIAPVIYGDGLQSRDFIHISDVVRANLIVMEHPKAAAKTFNVGRGVSTTLLEIIKEINYLTGKNLQPIHKEARLGDIRHSLADNTELKSLGWSPIVNIREGLADMLKTQT